MSNVIVVYRGSSATIPTLNSGQFGFTTDEHRAYIGDGVDNHELLRVEDVDTYLPRSYVNGSFAESFNALVVSDGTTITVEIEKAGTGDLTMQFSDGNFTLDCTPKDSINIALGTDSSPVESWVYILQSTKALTTGTTGWPSTEHIPIGYYYVKSASYTQIRGALINQNWNDHLAGTDNQGHNSHIGMWIRRMGANWFSGCDGTGTDGWVTIVTNVSAQDSIYIKIGSGVISQFHEHTYAPKDTQVDDHITIPNYYGDNWYTTHDLGDVIADALGDSLSGRYYNIVIGGVANKGGEFSPIMAKLPNGSYANATDAINDIDSYTSYEMPREFNKESSTGFPIARLTFKHSPAGGGTITLINTINLRGRSGATGGGGGTAEALYEFPDNQFKIYDNLDITKGAQFTLDNITAGNTRIYHTPDVSGELAVWTDVTGGQTLMSNNGATGAITVLDTGYVGINETTPLSQLHINGGVGSLSTGLSFGAGSAGVYEVTSNNLAIATASTDRLSILSTGVIQINTTPTDADPTDTILRRDASGNITHSDISELIGDIGYWDRDVAGYVYPATLTDKVGIGIATPSHMLTVNTDSGGAITEVAFFDGGGSVGDESEIIIGTQALSAASTILGYHYSNIQADNYGYLQVYSGTRAISWDYSGDVAIGSTSAAGHKLHVTGTGLFTGLLTIDTFGTTAGNFITNVAGVLQERTAEQVLGDIGGIGTDGSGTANEIAIWTDANTIEGTSALTFVSYLQVTGSVDSLVRITSSDLAVGIQFTDIDGSVDFHYFGATNRFSTAAEFKATNFISNVATGTQPYATTSTTLNTNLNADMVDGLHSAFIVHGTSVTASTDISGLASNSDDVVKSGFYRNNNAGNVAMLLNVQHAANTDYAWQMATGYNETDDYKVRHNVNGVWGNWRELLDSTNYTDYISGMNYWTLNGTDLYYTGGNVGIGTTTPTLGKLQVAGRTHTTDFTMTSGASDGYIGVSNATGVLTWTDPSTITGTIPTLQAVTGEGATTSHYIYTNRITASSPSAVPAVFDSTNISGGYIYLSTSNVAKGYLGSSYHLLTGGSADDIALRAEGALNFAAGGNNNRYTISATGNHNFQSGTATFGGQIFISNTVRLNTAISGTQDFQWRSNDLLRWVLNKSGTESGSNAGANLILYRYTDAGSYLGQVFNISRSTGIVTFGSVITAPSGTSTQWNTAYTHSQLTSGNPHNVAWSELSGTYIDPIITDDYVVVGTGTGIEGTDALTFNGVNLIVKSYSDAPLQVESTDLNTGIKFTDTSGSTYLFYNGSTDTFSITAELESTVRITSGERLVAPSMVSTAPNQSNGLFLGDGTNIHATLQAVDVSVGAFTYFTNSKYYDTTVGWVDGGNSYLGSVVILTGNTFRFIGFDTGVAQTDVFSTSSTGVFRINDLSGVSDRMVVADSNGDLGTQAIPVPNTVNDGLLTLATSGGGISGSASFTANQSGNSTFTVTSNATSASTVSTIAMRDSSGDINARLFRSEYDSTNASINFIMTQIDTATNNYIRPSTPTQFRTAVTDGYYSLLAHTHSQYLLNTTDTFTGTLTVNGDANLNTLSHYSDSDTSIAFGTDSITFNAGAIDFLQFNETTQNTIVFNEGGSDIDFRIESSVDSSNLFIDGLTGFVGIGTITPSTLLSVVNTIAANAAIIRVINSNGIGGASFAMEDTVTSNEWNFKATSSNTFKIRDNQYSLDVIVIDNNSIANAIYINTSGQLLLGGHTGTGTEMLVVDATGLVSRQAIAGGGGTVTSVAAGNGMNFSTITGTGTVTMGTPSTLTASTANSAAGTTHTHAITGFEVSLGNPAVNGYVLASETSGTRSWVALPTGGGMVYPAAGIALSTGTTWSASITNNSTNWNTAYGWGDHSGLYSLLAHTHGSYNYSATLGVAAVFDEITVVNGIVTATSTRNLTPTNIGAEDDLGNPSVDNYVLSSTIAGVRTWVAQTTGGSMTWPSAAGIAVYSGSSSWSTSITDNSANWNSAYGWGNHASAGYLEQTDITFTDNYLIVGTGTGIEETSNLQYNGTTFSLEGTTALSVGGDSSFNYMEVNGNLDLTVDNGRIFTSTDAANSGLQISPHVAEPTSLANGDIWVTSSGIYAQVGGFTKDLTAIGSTTINNNAATYLITGSGTPNTLEANSGLTYNSGWLIAKTTSGSYMSLQNNKTAAVDDHIGTLQFKSADGAGSTRGLITVHAGSVDAGQSSMLIGAHGTSTGEILIDEDGKVIIDSTGLTYNELGNSSLDIRGSQSWLKLEVSTTTPFGDGTMVYLTATGNKFLPDWTEGRIYFVANTTGSSINVFAKSGEFMNGVESNGSTTGYITVGSGGFALIHAKDSSNKNWVGLGITTE